MTRDEKILEVAQKLPGYYGYRPAFEGLDIVLKELIFRLYDEEAEIDYTMVLFCENGCIVEAIVDAKYKDGSMTEVEEVDLAHQEIIKYRNKLIKTLNELKNG